MCIYNIYIYKQNFVFTIFVSFLNKITFKMYKLSNILFIIRLYAQFNVFVVRISFTKAI